MTTLEKMFEKQKQKQVQYKTTRPVTLRNGREILRPDVEGVFTPKNAEEEALFLHWEKHFLVEKV